MPFTVSHSAIVLPLLRNKRFSATGLIAGSMTPDFEYFIRMDIIGRFGHHLPGLFYFDLPVGLALCFLFHLVVKKNLIQHLPVFCQRRLIPTMEFDFLRFFRDHYMVVIISVLVGGFSHIFWDSFTHEKQFFPAHFDVFKTIVFSVGTRQFPLWSFLQHLSTVVGGVILIWYFLFRMKEQNGPVVRPGWVYWVLFLIITSSISYVRSLYILNYQRDLRLIVSIIGAICVAVIVLGFIPFGRQPLIKTSVDG